jgi:arabinogalactan endo-1,4-beta-galactosidase
MAAENGTLRMLRSGTKLTFMHAQGASWITTGTIDVPATPVFVYLATTAVSATRALSAQFSNFKLSAGATDNIDYAQPASFIKRANFALGGVMESWPAFRYFGGQFNTFDPITTFRQNGMEWARVGVTTMSAPELAAVPKEQWHTLVFKPAFWGSREYAAATLRDAADRGMRLYAYLYFSDIAANWGNQVAPAAWAGKSVAETAALMEQHAFDTATYFKAQGLNVEIYELGNEIDIGMVDFVPLRRIAVPDEGVDLVNNRTWLRDNVWSVEATLLKAAAAGIRRAAPGARIALHAASIESGTGPQFGPEFYQAMRDFGVDYDIAALSNPYAQGNRAWRLSEYSTACWFRRQSRIVDQIAVPGKPVMIVEASYQNNPATLISKPMRDFPFTPAGQSDWLREQLRFATHHPSIVGWFWFYPERWMDPPDVGGEAYVLQFGSLLASPTTTQPALLQFRPNLGPVVVASANTVEYYHAGFDHYFITSMPDEITALDGGAFGGAWQRTGQSFNSYPAAMPNTVPVCRYFSSAFAPKSSHFYSANASECSFLRDNPDWHWQFESTAFYIKLPDATGSCPANTAPVYRLYNNGQGGAPNHRFTTDLATRNDFVARRGYVSEGTGPYGVSMCAAI